MAERRPPEENEQPLAAKSSSEQAASPFTSVGPNNYRDTLTMIRDSEKGHVIPVAFGQGELHVASLEEPQQMPASDGRKQIDLQSALVSISSDIRKGQGLSEQGLKTLTDLFHNANDPMDSDKRVMDTLSQLQDRVKRTLGADLLKINKTTDSNGTEHYFAAIARGNKAPQWQEIGTRELPEQYKPVLTAARSEGAPPYGNLAWDGASRKGLNDLYDHLANRADATPEFVGHELSAFCTRINKAIGSDRITAFRSDTQDGPGWIMAIGKTNTDRIEGLVNPNIVVRLGPFMRGRISSNSVKDT